MNDVTVNVTETEADYDRLQEYYTANDELRRLRWLLDNEATDDNYEELFSAWHNQSKLVREIAQTVTNWTV